MSEKRTIQTQGAEPVDGRLSGRRDAIIAAAETLFLAQGFERTSLAAIVAKSGGSLATVYAIFGNKHGLLRAVASDRDDEHLVDGPCEMLALCSPADALNAIAQRLHDRLTAPRNVAMMRLVIAEALRDREFARDFYCDVHLRLGDQLADLFRAWTAEGLARIDDPVAAAELFFATVLADAQLNAMIGIDRACDTDDAHRRIAWRLAPFITHFAIRSGAVEDTALGDVAGDEARGGDVEGRVVGA